MGAFTPLPPQEFITRRPTGTAAGSGGTPPELQSESRASADRKTSGSVARKLRILVAEDNPADVRLIRESLHHHGLAADIMVLQDGEAIFGHVERIDAGEAPCPDIVLLDLNLPRKSGHTVLERLRRSSICGDVPVIVVTSSNASTDRELAARHGASSYFRKPIDYDEFLLLGAVVRQLVEGTASAEGSGIA